MQFTITGSVRDGLDWLRSPNGMALLAGWTLLTLVAGGLLNGLIGQLNGMLAAVPIPFEAGLTGNTGLVGGLLATVAVVQGSVVAMRLCLNGRERLPRSALQGTLPVMLRLIGAGIIVSVSVLIGSLFFLLPGLFLLTAFAFYGFAIAEGAGTIEGIGESWSRTSGHRIRVFALILFLMLVSSGLNLLAATLDLATLSAVIHSTGTVGSLAVMAAGYQRLGGDTDGDA